jgi:AraC family transcriptional regulator
MQADDTVTPVLAHIQANLDQDLSLEALASRAGYSPFHFHRAFETATGETLKAYTQRVRLERAAFRLLFHGGRLIDIAADCGFANPETFSRAFRRRFGTSPSRFKSDRRAKLTEWKRTLRAVEPNRPELSATKFVRLREMHFAFIRHIGPYETVDHRIFDELLAWHGDRTEFGPPLLFGIGHDSPETTDPSQLRFDAALLVPGPFHAGGRIGHEVLSGGSMMMTSHAGPLASVGDAYGTIFGRLMAMKDISIVGLPAIEVYHTTRIDPDLALTNTDIYIPVEKRS